MMDWHLSDVHFLTLAQLGERYRRYRLPDPDAEAAMAGSLQRYGQLTPVVVCRREETHEVLDGFKRLAAARALGLKTLSIRLLEADERMAKAAILRAQPDRPAAPGVGRSLDRARPGARGRPDASRGRRAPGPAQELGLPAAGPGREAGRRGPARPASGPACRPRPHGHWCGCRPATRSRCWRRCTATS